MSSPIPQSLVLSRSDQTIATLAEAKAHLRIHESRLDTLIQGHLDAAHAQVESDTRLAARTLVCAKQVYPLVLRGALQIDFQPLLCVDEVRYEDESGISHALSSDSYRVVGSTGGAGYLWIDSSVNVTAAAVPDAMTVVYRAGWNDNFLHAPAKLKTAVLFQTAELFGNMDDKQMANNARRLASLKASLFTGQYR